MDIAHETGDRRNQGNWLGYKGRTLLAQGQIEQARTCLQEALAVSRAIQDRRNEGFWLGYLGRLCADMGQSEKAAEFYRQSLAVLEPLRFAQAQTVRQWLEQIQQDTG